MGRLLVENVIVADEAGGAFLCSAGLTEADLPAWAVEQIQTPGVWVNVRAVAPVAVVAASAPAELAVTDVGGPPPRSGPGSARSVWVAYAEVNGVKFGPDDTRDEIVDAVAKAGVAVE